MTIREIAAKTNMSTDTLRYYERIGLLPPVPRNAACLLYTSDAADD